MNTRRQARTTSARLPLGAAAFLLMLVMLLALTARPGSAAQLALLPGSTTSLSIADRCTEAVTATHETVAAGEVSTVTMTGLGAACGGRDLALTLFGADGKALTTATMPLAADTGDSTTVPVPAYAPADVAGITVTIGTWGVPAHWTYTLPVTSEMVSCSVLNDPAGTKTCEVQDVRVEAWGYPELDTYNFFATVTSPSASADVEWQLTINLADPEFKVPANLADSNNAVTPAPGWSCSSMPVLELRGQAAVDTKYVGGGKDVTVWMQGRNAPASSTGGNLFNCS